MDFYKMTNIERQILINQYIILKKNEKDKFKINDLDKKISYLENGYIYLFNDLNKLESIVYEQESKELMDILQLHDIIITSANKYNVKAEELLFDFTNDQPYPDFAEKIITSKDYPAFNNFKVINSHGSKSFKDHKKQIKYWKNTLKKSVLLNQKELEQLLNYHNLK